MTYRKFLVFKKDKHGELKFIEMIIEADFNESYGWKDYLNKLADEMAIHRSEILFFEFDDSKPCLELSYVHSIKSVKNTEHFKEIFSTNFPKKD